jgi:hypothetical protein
MSRFDEFDDHDSFVSRLGSRFGLRHAVLSVGLILTIAGGIWVVMNDDKGELSGSVPLIQADTTPYKVAPDEMGGMPVPNQNSTIFETLKGNGDKPRVENLLAEDEQPMTKAEIMPVEEKITTKVESTKTVVEMAPSATEKITEKVADERVAMIDATSDTAKPEIMPLPPEGNDIANTEPSAAPATKEEKPTEPKLDEPKKVDESTKSNTSGTAAIQFAAVKSDEEARKLWSNLQAKNPELQGKTLRVQKADLGEKGVFYRVQVAGLSSDNASSLCGSIKSRGGSCMIVK